ncbi:MarR family winged helix-turn-helix transcriptional regulator [Pseudomonas sp. Je.1.5.c]|uniref:MarR family winged helix-turn-helix transcriptional regulator n=1 Tax=Pseudomonas sp. Je.1.5.c TaxID=3142839 RepID=UPI003DA87C96
MTPSPKAAPPTKDELAILSPEVQLLVDRFQLQDIPSHLLRRAHFRAEEMFSEAFGSESITPRQKAALVVISQTPGLTQNALASQLFMDRNTIADMVKRLCANKLIVRSTAKEDARAYQLHLAPAGARLLERVLPKDVEVEQRLLETLPEEYRPLFLKCLKLMLNGAD